MCHLLLYPQPLVTGNLSILHAHKDAPAVVASSVQFSSVTQSCPTLFDPMMAAHQASLSITNFWSLPKLMSIELVMPFNRLILCCPLLLLPSIFPSIRVFSNESALRIRCPKYWSFSFSISPSNEHSGLISFRMDWLDLLAVQGTLKSLLQHHSSKLIRVHVSFSVMISSGFMPSGGIIGSHDSFILSFLRTLHTVLHSGCISLHSHQ